MFSKKKYLSSINAKGIFDNSYEEIIPQTVVHNIILKHFEKSKKAPKCLFLGWDGCRADAMKYLISNGDAELSGTHRVTPYSAIAELKKAGGLYVTYVGGVKGQHQETSTAQGWASAFCGKWMKKEYKTGWEWTLDDSYPTVMKTLALKSYQTSFSVMWEMHFDFTYKSEIEFTKENNLKQSYFRFETDEEIYYNLIDRLKTDDDLIVGIFENPDSNGHNTGFGDGNYRYVSGVCNLDRLSYSLLTQIKKRESFDDEDWLVVICSDHGGLTTRHGSQLVQSKTTFLAISKPIEELTN